MTSPHTIRNHSLCESERELPPGRWITRGAIKVFEPDQPAFDFGILDDDEQLFWDALARQFAARPFTPPRLDIKLCDDCGCALAPIERCPNCLVWAIRDAERWEWARESKANRHRVWEILEARKVAA